jgi:protein-tyrosine phosphatase
VDGCNGDDNLVELYQFKKSFWQGTDRKIYSCMELVDEETSIEEAYENSKECYNNGFLLYSFPAKLFIIHPNLLEVLKIIFMIPEFIKQGNKGTNYAN